MGLVKLKTITCLSAAQLRKAAAIKEKIVELEKQLEKLTGSTMKSPAPSGALRIRRKLSAVGRARKAAAKKAVWAKLKKSEQEPPPTNNPGTRNS